MLPPPSDVPTQSSTIRMMEAPTAGSISGLTPEILLSIFSDLDSTQLVISRRACQKWLEIINFNKSLWQKLSWAQRQHESLVNVVEMFDERSASTLREASIHSETNNEEELPLLLKTLLRSKDTLETIDLKIYDLHRQPEELQSKILDLASAPRMKSFSFWPTSALSWLPVAQLVKLRNGEQNYSEVKSQLNVFWCWRVADLSKLELNLFKSLNSFATLSVYGPQEYRPTLLNFCNSIVHLRLRICKGDTPNPVHFPSLKLIQGEFEEGFPSWFNCPNLQTIVLEQVQGYSLQTLPPSVRELWLMDRKYVYAEGGYSFKVEGWNNLSQACPKLMTLKITENFFKGLFHFQDSHTLTASLPKCLESREGPLSRLVLPTFQFSPSLSYDLRGSVDEVIDIGDYPDFVEIQY